jgi:hypothetical protein
MCASYGLYRPLVFVWWQFEVLRFVRGGPFLKQQFPVLTDYKPRVHDIVRIANAEIYSRNYSDAMKASCTA